MQYNSTGKTNVEIKVDVLLQLYNTGRVDGYYNGVLTTSKKNPLKGYINKFLGMNNIDDVDLNLCEECYQLTFQHLWAKSADKIVQMVESKGNHFWYSVWRIIINQCFARKENSRSSGLFHNILEKSTKQNESINTVEDSDEDGNNEGKPLIIYDEPTVNYFNEEFGFSIEEFIERLTQEDQELFYQMLGKQKVGRPSSDKVQQRAELFARIKEAKEKIDKENENNR